MRRAAIAVAALLLVSACGGNDPVVEGFRDNNPDGMHGIVLPKPYSLPDATLVDTHGQPYVLRVQTTKPLTLVFFGYTECPDICVVIMNDLASAVRRLPDDVRAKVGMLFISSDPDRDDPATLRAYLDRINPDFEGLTGPLPKIVEVADALGVAIETGDKLPSGGYAVAHGTQVVGVLPDGSAPLVWTDGTTPEEYASDIEKALSAGIPEVGSTP